LELLEQESSYLLMISDQCHVPSRHFADSYQIMQYQNYQILGLPKSQWDFRGCRSLMVSNQVSEICSW
jgi:hypothetical protein